MDPNPDRALRDQQIRDAHDEAQARGELRVLSRTRDGELHSYSRKEFGVIGGPATGRQVTTLAGLIIIMVIERVLVAGTLVEAFVIAPFVTPGDGRPAWGVLVATVMLGFLAWAGTHSVAEELRARKVRRQRGVPEPRAGSTR